MKFVTFAAAPADMDFREFQNWFTTSYLTTLRRQAPTLRGGVVRQRIAAPTHIALPASIEAQNAPQPDILLELWFSSAEDFRREVLPIEAELLTKGCNYSSHRVTPRLQKDPRISEAGPQGTRPNITFIGALAWLPTITPEFAAREWDEHAAIALRVQPAMTKYEQNLVDETISRSADAAVINAYADFSFSTIDDLVSGFRYSAEEAQDVSTFRKSTSVTFFGDADPLPSA